MLVACVLLSLSGFSQSKKADSLWAVYNNKALPDTNRLKALYAITVSYAQNKPDTALLLAENMHVMAVNAHLQKYEATALNVLGVLNMNKGNYPKALDYYRRSAKISEELGNKGKAGYCYHNISLVYLDQSDFPQALNYTLKELKIAQETGDKHALGSCYQVMGIIYKNQGDYEQSMGYYLKALKCGEETNNKDEVINAYTNIGTLYSRKKQYTQAMDHYKKALELNIETGNKKGLGDCYTNMGLIYGEQKDYAKTLEYCLKALKYFRALGDKQRIGACYTNLSGTYIKIKAIPLGIQYADSALQIGKEINDIDEEREAYGNLSEAYFQTGNYKEAYEDHIKFKALTDSIFNADNTKQLSDMKTNFEVEKKEAELQAKAEAQQVINKEEEKRQQFIIYAVAAVLLMVIIFSALLYKRFLLTNKQKEIIEIKSKETEEQKNLAEEKQKEIIDSITYAKRLQQAILPANAEIKKYLPDSFIYYRPKDIVAGDFYWMEHLDGITFIAAADSTGHGVPGAMVSVVCSNALNRAVKEFGLRNTGKILDKTRELVLETFEKSGEEIKDGMDISLLSIQYPAPGVEPALQWSGANNALRYITNATLKEIKADKQPIGKTDLPKPFTTHSLAFQKGDVFYLMTDGYPDQFGGDKGKKFKYKQLEKELLANSEKGLEEQKTILENLFNTWKGNLEQVDDVTIIGIKI